MAAAFLAKPSLDSDTLSRTRLYMDQDQANMEGLGWPLPRKGKREAQKWERNSYILGSRTGENNIWCCNTIDQSRCGRRTIAGTQAEGWVRQVSWRENSWALKRQENRVRRGSSNKSLKSLFEIFQRRSQKPEGRTTQNLFWEPRTWFTKWLKTTRWGTETRVFHAADQMVTGDRKKLVTEAEEVCSESRPARGTMREWEEGAKKRNKNTIKGRFPTHENTLMDAVQPWTSEPHSCTLAA